MFLRMIFISNNYNRSHYREWFLFIGGRIQVINLQQQPELFVLTVIRRATRPPLLWVLLVILVRIQVILPVHKIQPVPQEYLVVVVVMFVLAALALADVVLAVDLMVEEEFV